MSDKLYKCAKCQLLKPVDAFTPRKYNYECKNPSLSIRKPVVSHCKKCIASEPNRRNSRIKNVYGIDINKYNEIFKDQNGCCAICSRHQTEFKKNLYIDHNHITKEIRGLLCDKCNTGLGHFQDSSDILKKAINYLEYPKLRLVKKV